MTPQEFKEARIKLGLSQGNLGQLMKTTDRSVRRWENGDREIPGPVIVLMQAYLDGYRPEDWPA